MKLPDSLREKLKIPLGILLPECQADKANVQKYLSENSYVISVGDRTTEKMIDFGLIPSLQIIDGQEKREKRPPFSPFFLILNPLEIRVRAFFISLTIMFFSFEPAWYFLT